MPNITKLFIIASLHVYNKVLYLRTFMKNWYLILVSCLFLTIGFSACNSFEKIQKSTDYEFKLKKADEYFANKKWTEANTLYEELLTIYKGTKGFEDMYYKYAFSFYNQGNYLASSYHFKNFCDIFPNSSRRDECEYLTCICLYKMSPDATLDQSSTIKAIGALQTFVNTHPESAKLEEANRIIEEARAKLEVKDVDNAYLYFKIGEFKAASTAYANLLKKYPDSPQSDKYQYMVMQCNFNYAKLSIAAKQEERFNQCLINHTDFITNYPNSKYLIEVDKLKLTIFALQNKAKIK
jgi:outer membrane protein assembly factor BamD